MSTIFGQATRRGRYVITAGVERWLADDRQLLAVTEVSGLAPLPWTDAAVRGILSTACGPLPLLDPGPAPFRAPTLAAIVQTDPGPVAVAIAHVAALDPGLAPMDVVAWAERWPALMAGFAKAAEPPPLTQDAEPAPQPDRFLLLQLGPDSQVAVRASRVRRIERCQALRPVLGVEGGHHIVQAGDELLHAQPLSRLLGRPAASTAAAWCLQMQGDEGGGAVLVDAIGGLMEVPADAVRTVMVAGRPTHWLVRSGQPPLEIVLENASNTPAQQPAAAVQPGSAGGPATSAIRALRVAVGPYAVVFAQACLGPVMGTVAPVTLRRRARRDLRVWRLDRLLGLDTATQPTHALVVHIQGHSVVLLCPHIDALTALDAFAPVPALPQPLAGLLRGLRIREGVAELLLAPDPSPASLRILLRRHLRAARAGWLAPAWNSPEVTSDHVQ